MAGQAMGNDEWQRQGEKDKKEAAAKCVSLLVICERRSSEVV